MTQNVRENYEPFRLTDFFVFHKIAETSAASLKLLQRYNCSKAWTIYIYWFFQSKDLNNYPPWFLWLIDLKFFLPHGFFRSSHRRCPTKKATLKNFAIFTGKLLCWSLFLITLQALRPGTLLTRSPRTTNVCFFCGNCSRLRYET